MFVLHSFALFDTLAKVMKFDLTKKHMPDETEVVNIVVHHPPPKPTYNSRMGRTGGRSISFFKQSQSVLTMLLVNHNYITFH